MGDVKHTPGPWRVFEYATGNIINVRGAGDFPVAQIGWLPEEGGTALTLANAHLIAAAPTLLEAAEKWAVILTVGIMHGEPEKVQEAMDDLAAAIALAKGEQPDG